MGWAGHKIWKFYMMQHNIQHSSYYNMCGQHYLAQGWVHFITTYFYSFIYSLKLKVNERAEEGHWDSWWGLSPGSGYLWRHKKVEQWGPQ